MRKLLLSLLLAGVAASPALADPDHPNNHGQDRAERQAERQAERAERRESRQQERSAPAERPHFNGGGNFTGNPNGGQQNFVRRERFQQQNVQQGDAAQAEAFRAERPRVRSGDGNRGDGDNWRGRWQGRNGFQGQPANTSGDFRQQDRPVPNVLRRHDRSPVAGEISRRSSRWANGGWNRDWRNDRRYDWRQYRDRHRSIFHIGLYFDPFGYNYRPFNIGYQLYPAYYGQRYWIDPRMYNLPYPPPGTQWVRYFNDAVLVDMYSGEVIDVIQGFFW